MSNETVKVPKQFADDFDCVAKHYRLDELGERADARAAALRDLENAIVAFERMAGAVRKGNV